MGEDWGGVMMMALVVGGGIWFLKNHPDFLTKKVGPVTPPVGGAFSPAISPTPAVGGPTSSGTGTKDEFGVTKLYPDASPPKFSKTTGGGGIEHQTMASTGKHVDRREWEIRGPAFLNQEVTVYFNLAIPNPDTMSIKLRGGPHSGNACACNYIHYVPVNGDAHYFGAQCPHLNYVKGGKPLFTLPNVANKWIGAKAVEWNQGSGVHCETWIDLTGTAPGQWKKWIDITDTGQLGVTPMTKSPWSCPTAEILMRTDFESGGDSQAKFISAREITPPGGAGSGGGGGGDAAATKKTKSAKYAGYFDPTDYVDIHEMFEPDYKMIYREAELSNIDIEPQRITVV